MVFREERKSVEVIENTNLNYNVLFLNVHISILFGILFHRPIWISEVNWTLFFLQITKKDQD